ncbi:UNVERIFIED_CONTAM: Glutathione S-transferase U16 [Sesamum indicum]
MSDSLGVYPQQPLARFPEEIILLQVAENYGYKSEPFLLVEGYVLRLVKNPHCYLHVTPHSGKKDPPQVVLKEKISSEETWSVTSDIILGSCLGWLTVTEIIVQVAFVDRTKTPRLAKWADKFPSEDTLKDVLPGTEDLLELYRKIQAFLEAA